MVKLRVKILEKLCEDNRKSEYRICLQSDGASPVLAVVSFA
jgi:hypothetical protein